MERKISIVEYFYHDGENEGSRCGYCKSSGTSISQGMWGHQVTCQDYQDLIDRGWRRCDATKFQPSKSQKKLLKKVMKYLNDKPSGQTPVSKETEEVKNKPESSEPTTKDIKKQEPKPEAESKSVGADPDKPRCRKAKVMRMERKRQKLAAKGIEMPEQPKQGKEDGKTLEELIAAHLPTDQSTHRLERVLLKCDPDSPDFKKTYQQSFELFCKYQKEIHKDKPEKLNEGRVKLVRVDMENDDFKTTLEESHGVFAKYQINVHGDKPYECSFSQFKRFLVDSPLEFEKHSSTPTTGWGSFHEQFFLDGKLIAVGVLDILPSSISSVYFYYDTDYSFLSPGVYSALRELHLTRELNKSSSDLKYYYMGFYVHSCPKMKYKGQYSPSYLACPETYSWIPIEKCTPKLELEKYSRLDDTEKEDAVVDVNTSLILAARAGLMPYRIYNAMFKSKEDEKEVQEYAQLVGPLVAPRMALYRN